MNDAEKELSVIVPLYNEHECVEPMYRALIGVLDPLNLDFELIFVDDGSVDGTYETARKLSSADSRLRVIKFRRNFGQTPAMAAGIDNARGKVLVTMDGDLQNDPTDIPNFLAKIDEGFDIVVGWRYKRQDKLASRKIPSKIANWVIGKVTGIPVKDNGCSLKAYRGELIQKIPLYSDMHRFIPAMASLSGATIAEIKVQHHSRIFGESKYGLWRIYKVLVDLLAIKTIVSFASRPLVWFGILASGAITASLTAFVYWVMTSTSGQDNSPMIVMGVSLLYGCLGLFLLVSGVLCELIYKTGDNKVEDLSKLTIKL